MFRALLFLIVYRSLGFFQNYMGGVGSLINMITGRKETDKWILPFLPFIAVVIKVYYKLIGEELPQYYDKSYEITGLSNTSLFRS